MVLDEESHNYVVINTHCGLFLYNCLPFGAIWGVVSSWYISEGNGINDIPGVFDPSLEIIVACDTSDYGIGAVLSHKMPNGSEKPVTSVSHTLNRAEWTNSQIEKEALGVPLVSTDASGKG